MMVGDS
jgi:hypothetical protein